jgi:hypothetical protein
MAWTWKWCIALPCAVLALASFLSGATGIADWSIAWPGTAFFSILADIGRRFAGRAAARDAHDAVIAQLDTVRPRRAGRSDREAA